MDLKKIVSKGWVSYGFLSNSRLMFTIVLVFISILYYCLIVMYYCSIIVVLDAESSCGRGDELTSIPLP